MIKIRGLTTPVKTLQGAALGDGNLYHAVKKSNVVFAKIVIRIIQTQTFLTESLTMLRYISNPSNQVCGK